MNTVILVLIMGYSLATLIIVKSQAAQVVIGEPVVLQRVDLVLTSELIWF